MNKIQNGYFEVGVRYDKQMEDGDIRTVTETYLLQALSFTEAEKRATEELSPYISGDFMVVAEKLTNFADVITTNDANADRFYKIKHNFIIVNEKTGKEKKQSQYIVIQASSVEDAQDRYKKYSDGGLNDVMLEAVNETKYMDYFPYNSH